MDVVRSRSEERTQALHMNHVRSAVVAFGLALGAQSATADPASSAAQLLGRVCGYYVAASHTHASFTETMPSPIEDGDASFHGTVWLAPLGLMRWEYQRDDGTIERLLVFDGKTAWDINTIGEVIRHRPARVPTGGPVIFLAPKPQILSDYSVAIDWRSPYGDLGDLVLRLDSKDAASSQVVKQTIFLAVDSTDFHVKESVVVSEDGHKTDTRFSVDKSSTFSSSTFTFSPSSLPTYQVVP
jgi:outer membrane lipoprotein-sorting protein